VGDGREVVDEVEGELRGIPLGVGRRGGDGVAQRDDAGGVEGEGDVALEERGHRGRAQVGPRPAVEGGGDVRRRGGGEVDDVVRVGLAVQAAADPGEARPGGDRGDQWEVLQVVRAAVGVAQVVAGHAIAAEVDTQPGVLVDGIAADRVVDAGG